MAKLHFIYATMNAGKSTLLLQAAYNYRERGMRVATLISALDNRAGKGFIGSRIGLKAEAEAFGPDEDLFSAIKSDHEASPLSCVFVDEAQFMTTDQVWQLARIVDVLDIPVMAYGLRTDFRGELFPGSKALLAIADELTEARSICHCGRKATMVVRMGEDGKAQRAGAQVLIGGNETYTSLCRRHWQLAFAAEEVHSAA
ncbi:thymidine kinase [Rhizobium rosettiformans]|uniref:thymidine kinase n=1 Tax=Rhizobium rosettiformans TaxID=1368430 RepID=UPI002857FF87|nr:thymidine kinase [Rhizobium rosettiformans]MDR7029938.1 thymidine kinase [Rhizobium rosettiformans]MDR7063652.1 thymidine kinase [Rhizobium rosettiformans]